MANLDYQQLSAKLDAVLEKLQDPNVQVDQAIELYEKGIKLTAQLEKHLKTAENKLAKLKLSQSGDA